MKTTLSPYVWVLTAEYAPSIIGGLGAVATELTKALIASHAKISILTKSQSNLISWARRQNGAILRIPATPRYFDAATGSYRPTMIHQLTARYSLRKPDVIHVHSLEFARTALFLKQKHRIPIVYTCHSLISMESGSRPYRSKLQHTLIRQANKVVVPSMWLKREIQKRVGGVAFKIKVIPNGVSSFSQGTKVSPHQLLYVGRLIRSKGIEPLIGSIAQLSAKNGRVRLSIIGKGSSSYRRRLASYAKAKGVLSKIRWMGYLPHRRVQRLYASYGAVVVPSMQESFCLVALEAMANGVPLVASRAGGLKEFVNPSNAEIIPAVESRAIGRAIEAMWNHPRKTRQRVANARLVARRYQWHRIAGQYKILFKTGR